MTSTESSPRGGEVAAQALGRGLRADLGAHLLAGGECDVEVERADPHVHPALGAQAHLEPLALAVVERDVVEGVDVAAASRA
jgi:hypothetical protein